MEEIEVPLEQVQEDVQHHALHSTVSWLSLGALMSAVLAVFAAISALTAGHHANEAMIEQIHASGQWGYYQAKGIKASLLESRNLLLRALREPIPAESEQKLAEYRDQQQEIQARAKELEESSVGHLRRHQILAKAVTFFQVAIAMAAIAVLVRRRALLFVSGAFGACGAGFLILGLV